ncbi:MAG: LD-carboxypeptidase [Kiritimatiellaeota bacterium]|nr:LD-carboxypeptidase [Kiritimatiellota bacterium]
MDLATAVPPFPSGITPPFRRVGIWAPSGIPDPDRLALGIARLEAWGIEVVPPSEPGPSHRFFAGADTARAEALHTLLRTPHLDAVFAARGGYGAVRVLEHLDWDLIEMTRTPVIGYSDVTALHLAYLRRGLTGSVSGPMPAIGLGCELRTEEDRAAFAYSLRSLADAWTGSCTVALPPGTSFRVLRPGRARGPVAPANLSVLLAQIGTPWMPDLKGTLLVLEDIDEAAYRIDRGLTQLRQSGVLSKLAGLVFGDFRNVEDEEWLPDIFAEFAQFVPGPVAAGLPYGHCRPMTSVPVGRLGRLECPEIGPAVLHWTTPPQTGRQEV